MPRQIRERCNSMQRAASRSRSPRSRSRQTAEFTVASIHGKQPCNPFAVCARSPRANKGRQERGRGDYEQVRSRSGAGGREGNGGDPPALRVQCEVPHRRRHRHRRCCRCCRRRRCASVIVPLLRHVNFALLMLLTISHVPYVHRRDMQTRYTVRRRIGPRARLNESVV